LAPRRVSWPGAGEQPHDASVRGFDDLVDRVVAELEPGTDVVAQSMGGVVAVRLALRYPERLRRLVLVATSGGLDTGELGAADWRPPYRREYPRAAAWVTEEHVDHTDAIPDITAPTLLVWGARDPLSPVAVGHRLRERLPHAELHVIDDGTHSLAYDQPVTVAALIAAHLQ